MTALIIFKDGNHLIHPVSVEILKTEVKIPEWLLVANPFTNEDKKVSACGLNKKYIVYKEW